MVLPSKISRGANGIFFPSSEEQIITLIRYARSHNKKIRVVGSAHSIPAAIFADPAFPESSSQAIHLSLDFMNRIEVISAEKRTVRVGAGCRLDFDPYSITGSSTNQNGLLPFLHQLGWALNDLGGIAHQSVAGYLSTGSAGGSMQHSLYDQIQSVRFIDGQGIIHDIKRSNPVFFGCVISLGLLGIITEIVFECIPSYHISGAEHVLRIQDSPFKIEANKGDQRPSIEKFLKTKEYARLMWWPQPKVQKMVIWEAQRSSGVDPSQTIKKYRQMGSLPDLANTVAGQYLKISGNSIYNPQASGFLRKRTAGLLGMLNLFILADTDKSGKQKGKPQTFYDTWYHGLPMDYEMDDEIMPTEFTELWIPARYAAEAMATIQKHYERYGATATGSFCCEIYASKGSDYWLSPAYGSDAVRFDFFWFSKIKADPNSVFFPQFWDLLKKFKFRGHWGKYLPPPRPEWRKYIYASYPKFAAFSKLRKAMDPDSVFLTDYWASLFG